MGDHKYKITPDLAPKIVERANAGEKSFEIAAWLETEHGVKVCGRTIRRFLRLRREEASDVAKSMVREELRKHVLPCVGIALDLIERARRVERRAHKANDPDLELKAQDRQRKAIQLVLHHAGLNEPEHVAPTAVDGQNPRQQLMRRFDALVQAAAKGLTPALPMKN